MPTRQPEIEMFSARDAFNEALGKSAPAMIEAGERYLRLLDEYLGRLRRDSRRAPRLPPPGQSYAQTSSLGTAPKRDFCDSTEWARAERETVEAHLTASKKGGMK